MSVNENFVFTSGHSEGPLPLKQIKKRLEEGSLSYTDYLWSQTKQEWLMLASYFAQDFPPPVEPPPGIEVDKEKKLAEREFKNETFSQDIGISNEPIWFLYRDNSKFGPYRFLELVRLLQTNGCAPDDFVWKPGFDDWTRLRLCPEFEEEVLRKLAHLKSFGSEKVFIQRRFPRVPYESEVILHDEKRVLFGSARSLSEGGAFLEVAKPSHHKGDRIKIHFTPGGVSTPFNCIAEITQITKGPPSGYNVKFIYLEEEDRKRIATFAESIAGK
ncbi:MAG: GYF domain-containing protein [Oligoflexia bacterium]|nr:GYF domain-containing protein [Oligoflexia bacterium]